MFSQVSVSHFVLGRGVFLVSYPFHRMGISGTKSLFGDGLCLVPGPYGGGVGMSWGWICPAGLGKSMKWVCLGKVCPGGVGTHPSHVGKRAVHLLLECFLVFTFFTVTRIQICSVQTR